MLVEAGGAVWSKASGVSGWVRNNRSGPNSVAWAAKPIELRIQVGSALLVNEWVNLGEPAQCDPRLEGQTMAASGDFPHRSGNCGSR